MNAKVIAIVVGVLVLVGGGAYLMTQDKDDKTNSQNSQTEQGNQESNPAEETIDSNTAEVTGNLQSLRNGGKAQRCEMNYSDDSGSGTGIMYTDGEGRGRIQLTVVTEKGNTGESNTLVTDEKVYSWTKTDGGSFGFITDASTVQSGATGSPSTSNAQTAGKDFKLKCSSWTVDEAVLSVPTNVNFSAITASQ